MIVWKYKKAGWFWGFILRRAGFLAIATPWHRVYVLPAAYDFRWLQQHELMHALQCHELGISFWWLIVHDFVRYGYRLSPMEMEARGAERARIGVVHAR